MQQSKLSSFIESLFNVFIGYGVAVASQIIIFPYFNIPVSTSTNFVMGLWFTVISLIRSYIIRRWFNNKLHQLSLKIGELK